jgi:hypothetical protein
MSQMPATLGLHVRDQVSGLLLAARSQPDAMGIRTAVRAGPCGTAVLAICGSFNNTFGGVASQGVATCSGIDAQATWTAHPGIAGIRNDIIFASDGRLIVAGRFTVNGSAQVYMLAAKTGNGPWVPLGQPVASGDTAYVVKEFRTGIGSILLVGGQFTINGVKSLAYVWGNELRPIPFQTIDPFYGVVGTPNMYGRVYDISANEAQTIIVPGQAHGPIVVAGELRVDAPQGQRMPGGVFSIQVPRTPQPLTAGPPAWLDSPTWLMDSPVSGPTFSGTVVGSASSIAAPPLVRNVMSASQSSEALMLARQPFRRTYNLSQGSVLTFPNGNSSFSISGMIGTRYVPPQGSTGPGHRVCAPLYNTPTQSGFQLLPGNVLGGSLVGLAADGTDIYYAYNGAAGAVRVPFNGAIDTGFGQWELLRQNGFGGLDTLEGVGGVFASVGTIGAIRNIDAADGSLYVACQRAVFVRRNSTGQYTQPGGVGIQFNDFSINAIAAPRTPIQAARADCGCGCPDCEK